MSRPRPSARSAAVFSLCALLAGCAQPDGFAQLDKSRFQQPAYILKTPRQPSDDLVPGVDNFAVISPEVWRGAAPSRDGLNALAKLGVKTMIDLREEANDTDRTPHGVTYVRLPVSPWHADRVEVHKVLDAIARSDKPVFIHCQQGRDRTGLAIGAYRLTQGMSVTDACKELRNFNVNPWWQGPIERRLHELARPAAEGGLSSAAAAPNP